ncbi:sugar porter family MFS transporter [Levilactobacillus brevis]|uniref:sugar porter family MFS transporter n=1 Tax=Levilactobacillus brevis TaxID=1580 RepID=UPI0020CD2BBB|nr:sugar porter family MFS transporter [Levilactobacillus brevis]MCP9615017.1 sugar porter family MFS transporter [Levilactobacillus brevis]
MNRHLSTFFIFTFGALGGLLFGFDTGIISGASPLIESNFNLGIGQTGFITSSVLIGSSVGALGVGPLADRYGRKRLLILAAILFLLGSTLSMIAIGFWSMVVARIILGLAVGSASALTPAYLAELAPAERRGSLGTLFQLMITLGILLAYVSNLGFLNHNLLGIRDWRWMLGSALIPAALLLIGGLLLPESPRFLAEKGDSTQALSVLKMLRKNTADDPKRELAEIEEVAKQPKGGVKELFTIARPAVIVAVGIMLLQQLVGINSVIYFLPQVFIKGFGFAEGSAIWISVGIGIVNFVVTILATFIMDKFNRKAFLMFGSIVMSLSLGVLAVMNFTMDIHSTAVPTMILIGVYIFGFAISWGPIAWVLIGEIFPLSVRGIGSSIGSAANWIGNFLVSQFFLVMLAYFHNNVGGPFAVFAVFAVLSMFFVHYLVPETRGKSLEEIEMDLRHQAK